MAPPLPRRADVVIVGAGFAGLATAAALAERGAGRVVVLEAEPVPGAHGSGKNAAMARRVIEDPVLARLAVDSVGRMGAMEEERGLELVRRVGGLLLGDAVAIDALMDAAGEVPALRSDARRLEPSEAVALVPLLDGAPFDAAVHTSGCGVVDIHALLTALSARAREAGVTLHLRTRVGGLRWDDRGIAGVSSARGEIATRQVVNAAGFGANGLAALAGLDPLALAPTRRHLFVTAPLAGVRPDSPFVWNVSAGYYLRPEGQGLLLCACDETPWPPEDPPTDPSVRELLADKLATLVPRLADARPARGWAGLRVLTPDGRFAIGPDPRMAGMFWVAGLGGHGVTTSLGVGELAAEGIVRGALPTPWREAFAPGRPALLRASDRGQAD